MKTKTKRVPVAGEDNFLPEKVLAAEQKFAASMHREVATSPRRVAVSQRTQATSSPRRSGADMGQGFARVALSERTRSFVSAINRGVAADRQRRNEAAEFVQDSDALRSLGFEGRDEDDY